MKEYGPEDLDEARRLLECPHDIPIFVGHNPMWKWGEEDSIWIDALGTHHHVILYATLETKCPYISVKGSFNYTVKYADLESRRGTSFLTTTNEDAEDENARQTGAEAMSYFDYSDRTGFLYDEDLIHLLCADTTYPELLEGLTRMTFS